MTSEYFQRKKQSSASKRITYNLGCRVCTKHTWTCLWTVFCLTLQSTAGSVACGESLAFINIDLRDLISLNLLQIILFLFLNYSSYYKFIIVMGLIYVYKQLVLCCMFLHSYRIHLVQFPSLLNIIFA